MNISRILVLTVCAAAALSASADFVRMKTNRDGTDWINAGLWAFPLPMDWDGDGRTDLLVASPCVPYNGIFLFRARNDGTFDRAVTLSTNAIHEITLSKTCGREVVLSPSGAIWDIRTDGGRMGWKPLDGVPSRPHPAGQRGNTRSFVDYDGDGRDDILIGIGCWAEYGWANAYDRHGVWTNAPIRSVIYWCRNLEGRCEKAKYAKPEKILLADGGEFETYGNPMPMACDWDGDGDLDILCGSFIDGFTYYENTGTRTSPKYAARGEVRDSRGSRLCVDLQMEKPCAFDWDGDGRLDIVCGDEDGRVCWMRNAGRMENSRPVFDAPVYFRQVADNLSFGALSTPCAVDWDGDGDEDLICGNSAGYLAFIENLSGRGVENPSWAEPKLLTVKGETFRILAGGNGSIQGPAEAKWGYTAPFAADWDGDGFTDIVLNSIYGDIVWMRNSGKRGATDLEPPRPVDVEWKGVQPALKWGWRKPQGKALLTQWRTTPVAIDWNRDGLCDLVMLDHEGYLAFFRRFRDASGALRLAHPERVFTDAKGSPLRLNQRTAGGSGRRKLCFCDWDGDGRLDLVVNGVNAMLMRNLGESGGKTRLADAVPMGKARLAGHTTSPTACDFNADGIPDIVLGAEDGFFYYLRNPRR